jgi:catechol 2,3-dioxygenase-like lactoylglutathione lyase family enzyme
MRPLLTSVTLIAKDIARLREFYSDVLGLEVGFEEPGHIACMGVGPKISVCLHDDSDEGIQDGDTSLYFASDELDRVRERALAHGFAAELGRYATGEPKLDLRDPHGSRIRVQDIGTYPIDEWVEQLVDQAMALGCSKEKLVELVQDHMP